MLKHESTQSKRRLHDADADEQTNNKRVKHSAVTICDSVGESIPFHIIEHANGGEVIIERGATQHKYFLIYDMKDGRIYRMHLDHRIIVDTLCTTTMELALVPCSEVESNAMESLLTEKKSVAATLKKYPTACDKFEVAMVAMTITSTPPESLKLFSEPLQRNKELVLAAVQSNGDVLAHVSKELSDDEQVVMMAVKSDTHEWDYFPVLKYASERLRAIKNVVMAAVQKNGQALFWASSDLRADKEVVMSVVHRCGRALAYASEHLCADKEVVIAAVTQCGWALHYASVELRADKEVVMTAVTQTGHALRHASVELRSDREVIMVAVNQTVDDALRYASKDLRADKEVVMAAVHRRGMALEYASEDLRADEKVVITAVNQTGDALRYASKDLRAVKKVVLAAVYMNGRSLKYASEDLRADKDVVLAAVHQNGLSLQYASKNPRNDKEVVLSAVRQNKRAFWCASGDRRAELQRTPWLWKN